MVQQIRYGTLADEVILETFSKVKSAVVFLSGVETQKVLRILKPKGVTVRNAFFWLDR